MANKPNSANRSRAKKPAFAVLAQPKADQPAPESLLEVIDEVPAAVAVAVDSAAATSMIEAIETPVIEAVRSPEPRPEPAPELSVAEAPEPLPERSADAVAARSNDSVPNPSAEGTDTMATNFETMTDPSKAQAVMGDINERVKGSMEKGARFAEDMTDFHKGNLEAIVASGRVAAKGIETLAQDAAETARKNFEQATTTLKSMAQVKSPTEFFQLQSDFARSAFDQMVANASKASESMLKLAGDMAQPLSNRYAVAAEKVKSASL